MKDRIKDREGVSTVPGCVVRPRGYQVTKLVGVEIVDNFPGHECVKIRRLNNVRQVGVP